MVFPHGWNFLSDFSMQFTFSQIIWSSLFSRYHFEYMLYYVNECVSCESSEWTFENMDGLQSAAQYHRQFAHSTIMNVFLCLLVFPEVMWMQLLNVLNIHNTIWIVVNMNFYVIFWRQLWLNWLNLQNIFKRIYQCEFVSQAPPQILVWSLLSTKPFEVHGWFVASSSTCSDTLTKVLVGNQASEHVRIWICLR